MPPSAMGTFWAGSTGQLLTAASAARGMSRSPKSTADRGSAKLVDTRMMFLLDRDFHLETKPGVYIYVGWRTHYAGNRRSACREAPDTCVRLHADRYPADPETDYFWQAPPLTHILAPMARESWARKNLEMDYRQPTYMYTPGLVSR